MNELGLKFNKIVFFLDCSQVLNPTMLYDNIDSDLQYTLELIDQVMKVLERVVESLIRQRVEIDEMQCGFMSGRGTTDAIFIIRQLQEKHLTANKPLYMAFVDLEKAFDRVP